MGNGASLIRTKRKLRRNINTRQLVPGRHGLFIREKLQVKKSGDEKFEPALFVHFAPSLLPTQNGG